MSSITKQYLADPKNINTNSNGFVLRNYILCNDGFIISVQASKLHYCSPKEYLPDGNYDSVEIGRVYINNEDKNHFTSYLDDFTNYGYLSSDGSVIGFCPIERVDEVIKLHGGIFKGGYR